MNRRTRLAFLATAALLGAAVAAAVFLISSSSFGGGSNRPSAVIVDQLDLTYPNPAFARDATSVLEKAGFEVDYYPGEEVTVDFYRELPARGYDIVLMRAHSARYQGSWQGEQKDLVEIFTSEGYSLADHAEEQQSGRLGVVSYFDDPEQRQYFGITPEFITGSMRGDFNGATVILMGCNGLSTGSTAQAFMDKGAAAVVGWDEAVSAVHTDAATLSLLRHLIDGDLPADDAVAAAMDEVGPDVPFDSTLRTYKSAG
ncbi:MAG: hypothetical protein WEE64_12265 [Dehalococcoidia bacterium]